MDKAISCHLDAQQLMVSTDKDLAKFNVHHSALASALMNHSIDAKVLKKS